MIDIRDLIGEMLWIIPLLGVAIGVIIADIIRMKK